MKLFRITFLLATLMVAGFVGAQDAGKNSKAPVKNSDKQTVEFCVNMDCKSCETKITEQLRFEKGVVSLKTDLKDQKVSVTFKKSKTDTASLAKSIRELGYIVKPFKK